MDYKSKYRYEGKEKIMTVKSGSLMSTLFFVLALIPMVLSFLIWDPSIWWLSFGNALGALFSLFVGWVLLKAGLTIWVTEDRIIVDQAAPFKKIPRIECLISEVKSVKKDYVTIGSGTRRIDIYPIYLIMKDGTMKKIASISSDIKMADEIRNFLIKRAGIAGGSLIH